MPTTPTSMVNRMMGVEAWTDPIALPAGTTIGSTNLGSAVVDTTATTLAVTAALHAGKTITISAAAPIAITLPAATGTNNAYRFVVLVAATATASTISTVATGETMTGIEWFLTTSSAAVVGYKTTATDNTISINGTTKAGVKGDVIELRDVATSIWSVQMFATGTGSQVTVFSHV